MKKPAKVKARKLWGFPPTTRVVPDKRKRPFRKGKHKGRHEVEV